MSDYPLRVEISEEAWNTLYDDCADECVGKSDWRARLFDFPRLPEPEQRACVGCARYVRYGDGSGGWCNKGSRQASGSVGHTGVPWGVLGWDPKTAACPAWQPRRDKAEELAATLADELYVDFDACGMNKTALYQRILKWVREAGIGGESDE